MSIHAKQMSGKSKQTSSETATISETTKDAKSVRNAADAQQIPAWVRAWRDGLPPVLRLQTKFTVNQPGDVYEQEADQIAEQVMRMTDLQTSVSDNEGEVKNSLMRKQSTELGSNAATDTSSVPPIVHEVLNSGGGQPLDTMTRAFMERRFGHDFSKVRVHTDGRAAESARGVNALAYTVGRDVVFGTGQYAPRTSVGERLIAHELVHTLQQTNGSGNLLFRKTPRQRTLVEDFHWLSTHRTIARKWWSTLDEKQQERAIKSMTKSFGDEAIHTFLIDMLMPAKEGPFREGIGSTQRAPKEYKANTFELSKNPRLALQLWPDLSKEEREDILIHMTQHHRGEEEYTRTFLRAVTTQDLSRGDRSLMFAWSQQVGHLRYLAERPDHALSEWKDLGEEEKRDVVAIMSVFYSEKFAKDFLIAARNPHPAYRQWHMKIGGITEPELRSSGYTFGGGNENFQVWYAPTGDSIVLPGKLQHKEQPPEKQLGTEQSQKTQPKEKQAEGIQPLPSISVPKNLYEAYGGVSMEMETGDRKLFLYSNGYRWLHGETFGPFGKVGEYNYIYVRLPGSPARFARYNVDDGKLYGVFTKDPVERFRQEESPGQ